MKMDLYELFTTQISWRHTHVCRECTIKYELLLPLRIESKMLPRAKQIRVSTNVLRDNEGRPHVCVC